MVFPGLGYASDAGVSFVAKWMVLTSEFFVDDSDIYLAVNAAIRASELALGDAGRVLVRASGTEPLLRVMVEAHDLQLAKSQAQNIVNSIENVR